MLPELSVKGNETANNCLVYLKELSVRKRLLCRRSRYHLPEVADRITAASSLCLCLWAIVKNNLISTSLKFPHLLEVSIQFVMY